MIPPGAGVIALVGGLEQTHHPIRRRWNRAALLGRRSARTNYRWPDDVAERPRYPGAPGTPSSSCALQPERSPEDVHLGSPPAPTSQPSRRSPAMQASPRRLATTSAARCPSRREGRAARVLPPGFVLPRRISVKPFRSCQSLPSRPASSDRAIRPITRSLSSGYVRAPLTACSASFTNFDNRSPSASARSAATHSVGPYLFAERLT